MYESACKFSTEAYRQRTSLHRRARESMPTSFHVGNVFPSCYFGRKSLFILTGCRREIRWSFIAASYQLWPFPTKSTLRRPFVHSSTCNRKMVNDAEILSFLADKGQPQSNRLGLSFLLPYENEYSTLTINRIRNIKIKRIDKFLTR